MRNNFALISALKTTKIIFEVLKMDNHLKGDIIVKMEKSFAHQLYTKEEVPKMKPQGMNETRN